MFIVKSEGEIMVKKSVRQLFRWKVFICGNYDKKLKSTASLASGGRRVQWGGGKMKGGRRDMPEMVSTIASALF